MNDRRPKIKRRNIFSYPKFQIKIVLIFGFLAIMYAATNYVVSKTALKRTAAQIRELSLDAASHSDIRMILHEQGVTLDIQLMLFTFLIFFVLTMGGVFLSHVLGGPIQRINNYTRNIVAGTTKAQRITFRKYDFFHEFAKSFNLFQEHLGLLKKEPDQPAGAADSPEPPS